MTEGNELTLSDPCLSCFYISMPDEFSRVGLPTLDCQYLKPGQQWLRFNTWEELVLMTFQVVKLKSRKSIKDEPDNQVRCDNE